MTLDGRLAKKATGVMVSLSEFSFPWLPMLEQGQLMEWYQDHYHQDPTVVCFKTILQNQTLPSE